MWRPPKRVSGGQRACPRSWDRTSRPALSTVPTPAAHNPDHGRRRTGRTPGWSRPGWRRAPTVVDPEIVEVPRLGRVIGAVGELPGSAPHTDHLASEEAERDDLRPSVVAGKGGRQDSESSCDDGVEQPIADHRMGHRQCAGGCGEPGADPPRAPPPSAACRLRTRRRASSLRLRHPARARRSGESSPDGRPGGEPSQGLDGVGHGADVAEPGPLACSAPRTLRPGRGGARPR